jgi:hypothetical protein
MLCIFRLDNCHRESNRDKENCRSISELNLIGNPNSIHLLFSWISSLLFHSGIISSIHGEDAANNFNDRMHSDSPISKPQLNQLLKNIVITEQYIFLWKW